jgi:hypothetical protein
MPIIRKFAIQGHAVPSGPTYPRGPFPPDIFAQNPRAEDMFSDSDSLHEAFDNTRLFKCRYCLDVLYEGELDTHDCNQEEE